MKTSGKKYLLHIFVLLLGISFNYSHAAENSNIVVAQGTVFHYNRKQNTITIGDGDFFVDNNVVINNQNGVRTTSFQLTKGTKIRFEYVSKYDLANPNIPGTIKTIWLK